MQRASRFCVPSQELEDAGISRPADDSKNGSAAASEPRLTPFAPAGLQGPCQVTRSARAEVCIGPIEKFELAPTWKRAIVLCSATLFGAVLAAAAATGLIELGLWVGETFR